MCCCALPLSCAIFLWRGKGGGGSLVFPGEYFKISTQIFYWIKIILNCFIYLIQMSYFIVWSYRRSWRHFNIPFFKYALTLTHTMHNYNHASIVHSHRNVKSIKIIILDLRAKAGGECGRHFHRLRNGSMNFPNSKKADCEHTGYPYILIKSSQCWTPPTPTKTWILALLVIINWP